MKTFNFLSALVWDKLLQNYNLSLITFWGFSWKYFKFNNVIYIIYDGWHVATKTGNKVSYNPEIKISNTIKKEIRKLK